jgi:hypothetical protein
MIEIILERLVKISIEVQNQQLRLFSRVDTTTKLKILEHQKALFHKLKDAHGDVDNTVLTLSSLILAIDGIAKGFDVVNLNAIKLRGKNNKAKVKRQKMLGYWAIVKTLKLEQKMSFREISKYFAKYHRLEVAHSTIYRLWKELEQNKEIQQDVK